LLVVFKAIVAKDSTPRSQQVIFDFLIFTITTKLSFYSALDKLELAKPKVPLFN